MESGKVVLVTAAAGGTGQFAVQVCFFILSYSIFCEYFLVLRMLQSSLRTPSLQLY